MKLLPAPAADRRSPFAAGAVRFSITLPAVWAVVAVAMLSACDGSHGADAVAHGDDAGEASDIRGRLSFVEVMPAEDNTLVYLPAQVRVPMSARHLLAPPIEAMVLGIHVDVGAELELGTELASMQSPDQRAARTAEQEWREIARQRQAHAESLEARVEAGFQSSLPLQEAQLAAREAEASARRARSERSATQSWVDNISRDGGWIWRSGVSGVVTTSMCSPGTRVQPANSCFEVVDIDRAEVEIRVPERWSEAAREGSRIDYSPASGGGTQRLVFSRRAPVLDATSRTRSVFYRPPTDSEIALVPGASGRAALITDASVEALAVPRASITELGGGDVVFVDRDAPALPAAVTVEVVGRWGADALVLSDGLSAGDSVVSRGAFLMKSLLLLEGE